MHSFIEDDLTLFLCLRFSNDRLPLVNFKTNLRQTCQHVQGYTLNVVLCENKQNGSLTTRMSKVQSYLHKCHVFIINSNYLSKPHCTHCTSKGHREADGCFLKDDSSLDIVNCYDQTLLMRAVILLFSIYS